MPFPKLKSGMSLSLLDCWESRLERFKASSNISCSLSLLNSCLPAGLGGTNGCSNFSDAVVDVVDNILTMGLVMVEVIVIVADVSFVASSITF